MHEIWYHWCHFLHVRLLLSNSVPCCLQIKEHLPQIYMGLDVLFEGWPRTDPSPFLFPLLLGMSLVLFIKGWDRLTIISRGTFINEWNWRQHFLHNFIHCEINFILFFQITDHLVWTRYCMITAEWAFYVPVYPPHNNIYHLSGLAPKSSVSI